MMHAGFFSKCGWLTCSTNSKEVILICKYVMGCRELLRYQKLNERQNGRHSLTQAPLQSVTLSSESYPFCSSPNGDGPALCRSGALAALWLRSVQSWGFGVVVVWS